jgi:hypothetical protein
MTNFNEQTNEETYFKTFWIFSLEKKRKKREDEKHKLLMKEKNSQGRDA